jgi:hypothetical protein
MGFSERVEMSSIEGIQLTLGTNHTTALRVETVGVNRVEIPNPKFPISDNFQISYLTEFTFDELAFPMNVRNSTVSDVMKANAVIHSKDERGPSRLRRRYYSSNFIMFAPACCVLSITHGSSLRDAYVRFVHHSVWAADEAKVPFRIAAL